jgi:hypothetical protein
MKTPQSRILLTLLIAVLMLSACNLPASPEPSPTGDQSAAYTAAAETIIAQLTEVAETLTPTISGGDLPETTPTIIKSTPTEIISSPTEPASTATSPSTPSPSPTATLPAGDPRTGLGDPEFYDTFASGESWPLYKDEHVSFEVKDSKLSMIAFNPDHYNGWMLTWPVIEHFYLEMTAKPKQCSGLDQYGMMSRATKTEKGYIGYLFGVSCDGHYSLRKWNGEKYIPLVDWTESDHINAGANQTNRIGLMAEGDRLSMYANGQLLQEFSDNTYQLGRFGVFVGSANTPDFKTMVDEIAYWNIP